MTEQPGVESGDLICVTGTSPTSSVIAAARRSGYVVVCVLDYVAKHSGSTMCEEVVRVSHCLCDPCILKRVRFRTADTLRRTGVLRKVPRTSLVELRECDLPLHLAKYKSHP